VCLAALPQAFRNDEARQIHWQRSLDDALAVARIERRPLFLAVNADGESASDRIVTERYHDPRWVGWTRSFVCVVGSYFRHTPRDRDDEGRRIECPRLGEVTCGEHMALEVASHERFLAGKKIELFGETTERISPRHVLLLPDGTQAWDLYLLFDLADLDAKLEEASRAWPAGEPRALGEPPADRRHRARLAFERALEQRPAAEAVLDLRERMLGAALRGGEIDRSVVDELAPLLSKLDPRDGELRRALFDLASTARASDGLATAVRARLATPDGADWMGVLFDLVGEPSSQRSQLLSYAVLGDERTARAARAAAAERWGAAFADAALPPPCDALAASAEPAPPARRDRQKEALPNDNELEVALDRADAELASAPGDAEKLLAFGRAALLLARSRMASGGSGIDLLLTDARGALDRAAKLRPNDVALALDRARIANYEGRFEDQERLALGVVDPRGDGTWTKQFDDTNVEAYRWLGDASARLLAARSGGDPLVEARGMARGAAAFSFAARSSEADSTDWLSLASFHAALGRSQESLELTFEGLRRFPASDVLRAQLASACWALGRPRELVARSEELARLYPDWAECAWYAGYALVAFAESARRDQSAQAALDAYTQAAPHFERALQLEPGFATSSRHYLGMCALGRGFAQLLAGRRDEAARCAVEAARAMPGSFEVRDGLDREGVDLIDGVLEWRQDDPSPVDALAWLAELEGADARNAFYARSISDAELREALRAFGRGAHDLGRRHLRSSIAAARRALALNDDERQRRALAQADTILAEFELERGGDVSAIAAALTEAAPLLELGERVPPEGAERAAWSELAAALRERLGEARPVFRRGR
jgi:tetratricopeptide (TPR) repeat protein